MMLSDSVFNILTSGMVATCCSELVTAVDVSKFTVFQSVFVPVRI